jgi:hypothetical protein
MSRRKRMPKAVEQERRPAQRLELSGNHPTQFLLAVSIHPRTSLCQVNDAENEAFQMPDEDRRYRRCRTRAEGMGDAGLINLDKLIPSEHSERVTVESRGYHPSLRGFAGSSSGRSDSSQ